MHTLTSWFTPERRQGIQALAASLVPLLILWGFGTEQVWDQWLIILGAALQFFSNALSLANLKPGEWGKGWEIARGAIYTLGLSVAPALVVLGFWTEEFSSTVLTGVALALSVLGNLVAVLTSGAQQREKLVQAVTELTPNEG